MLVIERISNFDLLRLKRIFNKSTTECINFLTNMIYSLGYHHNKSHHLLSHISTFLSHNDNFHGLVIQISSNTSRSTPFTSELRNRVNLVKQGEGLFIFDAHSL